MVTDLCQCDRQCHGDEFVTVFENTGTDICQCDRECNEHELATIFESIVTDMR